MNAYKEMIDSIAMDQMPIVPSIPDYRLGIGFAETLASVPILIFSDMYLPQATPTVQPIEQRSFEDVAGNLQEETVSLADFPMQYWFGSPTVGV